VSKKIVLGILVLVLVAAVGGGSFYGGMRYEQQQAANARAAFFANRGGGSGGEGAGGGGFAFGGGNGGGGTANGRGGGAVGQIKSIDGNTITVSTPQSVVKVILTGTTQIEKFVAGSSSDLQVGTRIVVRGTPDSSGTITANTVQITPTTQGQ
jgi:uncharacterized protein DUF5666